MQGPMRTLVTLFIVSALWVSIALVNSQAAKAGDCDISPTGPLNKAAGLKKSEEFNHTILRRLVERQVAHFIQKRRRARARAVKRVTQRPRRTLRPGMWGGPHGGLNVTAARVEIEFDCAHGTIDQPIKLDRDGRFDVIGTFVPEGGPISVPLDGKAIERKSFSARYRGCVEGDKLLMKVTIRETGADLDVLTLTHDKRPILEKCY